MKITNKYNLPKPFVDAIERDYKYTDKQYSATTLLKGTCQAILERRYNDEIEQDVADSIFLLFGSALHKVLEESKENNDELKETKIVIDMPNGYKLSGIQDLYSEGLKRITDYKTGSVNKVLFNDFEDYRKQILIYAYMFRKIGFEVDNGEIVMLLKDYSKTKAKIDKEYPQHPVYVKHFDFSENDFIEIEKFIIDKFKEIQEQEARKDDELIPCTQEERWGEDEKYAVMEKGKKRAIRVYDTKQEAEQRISELNDSKFFIETRQAVNRKCENYCNVCKWCKFYTDHYGEQPKQQGGDE